MPGWAHSALWQPAERGLHPERNRPGLQTTRCVVTAQRSLWLGLPGWLSYDPGVLGESDVLAQLLQAAEAKAEADVPEIYEGNPCEGPRGGEGSEKSPDLGKEGGLGGWGRSQPAVRF